jgi:hypothetical protein
MTSPELDIDIINPALHEQDFNYPGDFGPGRPNKPFLEFHHITEWRDYLLSLQIRSAKVPVIHVDAYHLALRMLLLAWADAYLIKPAELQALRSLESALRDVYFQVLFERRRASKPKLVSEKFRPGLRDFLDHMAAEDDLDPMLHNESKKATGNALNVIRNGLAHGDPFNGLPWGGLLEAVRDVMEHAYRNNPDPPSPYLGMPESRRRSTSAR